MEEELGFSRRTCANLSIISGGPVASWLYYQRNQDKLKSAKLVVFLVDEWHFNGRRPLASKEQSAPSQEPPSLLLRWQQCITQDLLSLRFLSCREKVPQYLQDLQICLGIRERPTMNIMIDSNDQTWFTPYEDDHRADLTEVHYRPVIESYYHNFGIDDSLIKPVRDLCKAVREAGGQFVLLQMPNRTAYHKEVLRLKGSEFQAHVQATRKLAAELQCPLYFFEHPTECGITDECYTDGVHLRPTGAWQFTRFLARFLKEEKLLERAGL
jgi:hypothetical protein